MVGQLYLLLSSLFLYMSTVYLSSEYEISTANTFIVFALHLPSFYIHQTIEWFILFYENCLAMHLSNLQLFHTSSSYCISIYGNFSRHIYEETETRPTYTISSAI